MLTFDRFPFRPVFDKDNGASSSGGSSSDDADDADDAAPNVPTERLPADVVEALRKRAEREGSYEDLAALLYSDNKKQRDHIKNLEKTTPPEDAVVLKGEEAERYQKITGEDGDLSTVAKKTAEYEKLKKKEAQRRRKEQRENAAKAAGFDPEAVEQLFQGRTLDVIEKEVETEEGETKKVSVGVVKVKDDDGDEKPVPLQDYAKENFPRFLPVLKREGGEGDVEEPTEEEEESTGGLTLTPTGPGGSGSKKKKSSDVGGSYVQKRYGNQKKED